MIILNQDKDKYITKGEITYKAHYVNDCLYGFNVYSKVDKRKKLLGTYDTIEDAVQITNEINRLSEKGIERYVMPEPYLDFEDLGIIMEAENE